MLRASLLLVLFCACEAGQVASATSHGADSGTGSATTSGGTTGGGTTGGTTGAGSGGTAASTAGESSASSGASPTEAGGDTGDEPPPGTVRFAVIGDYGLDQEPTREVAAMITSWAPDFVATVGDNNYYTGSAEAIDVNIGKHYHAFIAPYHGTYGLGAAENRFFPSPGNHDWDGGSLDPYLAYFTLPGNERYYQLRRGPIELFFLDSDVREPDGVAPDTIQGQWLEAALAESDAAFKVVLLHHPPRSSGYHRDSAWMQWPYAAWGADLVLGGHDHNYERIVADGLPILVNGAGGAALRPFGVETVGSQRGHSDSFGALRITVDPEKLVAEFVAPGELLIDRVTLFAETPEQWSSLVPSGASWRYEEHDPGPGWAAPGFDDATWAGGAAPLGYGVGGEGTTLPGGALPVRPMTTYLRHRFSAGADSFVAGAPLRMRLAVDDGAVVYLNGVEVYRINLPAGKVTRGTRAVRSVSEWFAPRMSETLIDGDALVAGENVLAVEVHQHFVYSSDLRLELELAAGVP